jgi:hypothetical protein
VAPIMSKERVLEIEEGLKAQDRQAAGTLLDE